jgi:hypothetical protein
MSIDIVRCVQDKLRLEDSVNLAYSCRTYLHAFARCRKERGKEIEKFSAGRLNCFRNAKAVIQGPCWSSRDLLVLIRHYEWNPQGSTGTPQGRELRSEQDHPWMRTTRHIKTVGKTPMKQRYLDMVKTKDTQNLLLTAPGYRGEEELSSRHITREVRPYNLWRYVRVIEFDHGSRTMNIEDAVNIGELEALFKRAARVLLLRIDLNNEELEAVESLELELPHGEYRTRLEDASDASSRRALCVCRRHSRLESGSQYFISVVGFKDTMYAERELLSADASDGKCWEAFFEYIDTHEDGLFTW